MKHDDEWFQGCRTGGLDSFNAILLAKKYAEHVVSDKQAHDTLLNGLNVLNGEAVLSLEGGACGLLADAFAGQFKESGATNYLVLDMSHEDTGPMTITMQRREGSTPAERLRELSDENAALKEQIAALTQT